MSADGRTVSYEVWVYVPPQPRFRPRGGNIQFLMDLIAVPVRNEVGTRGIEKGTLAYLEVGDRGQLMIRTHIDFNDTIHARQTVVENPVGTWTKIVWEVKGSNQADGYVRAFVNDSPTVELPRRTLTMPGGSSRSFATG